MTPATDDTAIRILRGHSVLAKLSEISLNTIAIQSVVHKSKHRGAVVVPNGHFGVVGFGLVKTETMAPVFLTHLSGPGEDLQLAETLLHMPPPRELQHTVLTENAVVVFVPFSAVALNEAAATALAVERHQAYVRATERMLMGYYAGAEARLAQVLIELFDRFGDEREDGTLFIPLQLTRNDLAALGGMTVETAIRMMTAWAKAGVVSKGENNEIQIRNRGELRRIGGV